MCGTDKDFYWDFPTYALIVYINYHHVCFPITTVMIYHRGASLSEQHMH